ncbi:MAG: hypothetical protein O7G83_12190 [Proteobacteria bacterium]|nr:hypothetical protein [Pseudomonadota bacterium]
MTASTPFQVCPFAVSHMLIASVDRTEAANGDVGELPHEMAAELRELGLL